MEFEEGLESTIESLEIKNVVLNNIKTNYNALESEVLDLLENKVGIKEVKDKSSSIIQDNDTQEAEEEESESNETSETVVDKDIVDRDKDFNTSALEVKGKATVSAKMKRFLAGIPIVNLKTKTIEKGFLGLTRYYDFKDLDDQIKVALNSPSEIDSDFEKVKAKLQSLKDQYLSTLNGVEMVRLNLLMDLYKNAIDIYWSFHLQFCFDEIVFEQVVPE